MVIEFAFVSNFICNPAYMVCVDFNGRTAYAYLCRDHLILSEVWLYNAGPAPELPEWREESAPPYANAREFVREDVFVPPGSQEAIEVQWFRLNGEVQALVYIHGDLHATLLAGERVGRCRLARKNSPVARKLVSAFH